MYKVKHCTTFFQKLCGVMLKKKFTPHIFHFEKQQHISIHTWFVLCPIDVYFYDKNKKLIEIKKNLKPFSFYKSKNKAKLMIEVMSR
ncbi:DUF192 domain-containing protein [Candidatus Woesearchaeota archaeon]|nr:DUF192 domain-containing protein [Candidatus Woesearchaeota archaeon]